MGEKKRKVNRFSENLEDLKEWLFEVDGRQKLREDKSDNGGEKNRNNGNHNGVLGVAILGKEGLFTYADQTFTNLFSYEEPEELLSKNWQALFNSETVKEFNKSILPQFSEEGEWKGEISGLAGEDSPKTISLELSETTEGEIIWKATKSPAAEGPKMGANEKIIQLREGLTRLQDAKSRGDIYNITLEIVQKVLEPDICVLYLEGDNTLIAKGKMGTNGDIMIPNGMSQGLSNLTLRKNEVIRGEDFEEYTRYELPREDFHSFVSVPVDDMATLQVISSSEGYFPEEDVNLLQILARHVGERIARAEVEGELRHQAIHDQLTGLYNRHYLNEILTKEVDRAQRYEHSLSFLMIDINGFKEVNDRYSHSKGDTVLVEIGKLLKENVREVDTVIRYGGDEFLILLPETGEGSQRVVERLKKEMENWNERTSILDFPLSLAIGCSNFDPQQELSVKEEIMKADRNMYEDKNSSSNM